MEAETLKRIEETVLEILKDSNMDEMTAYKVREMASEELQLDLSDPDRKRFVRKIIDSFLAEQQPKSETQAAQQDEEEEEPEEEEEEEEEERKRKKGRAAKEYDDDGNLIICRLSDKRRVTISEFRGRTLVSIREYYRKDGKQLPTSKGISLTAEQWLAFKKNVPAIEKVINKFKSRSY